MAVYYPENRSASASHSSLGALVRRDSVIRPSLRTLDDIRIQVAREVAMRAIAKNKIHDGVRIGVCLVMSKNDDESFLRSVATIIQHNLQLYERLFIVGTTGANSSTQPSQIDPANATSSYEPVQTVNTLIICGSSLDYIDRARLLTGSKFLGRIFSATDDMEDKQWIAGVLDLGADPYDEDALWDAAKKSVRSPTDPTAPPPGSKGIDEILEEARAKLARITPQAARAELISQAASGIDAPTFLVDIRPEAQREREGGIGGSLIIERNVLEWRFDPRSDARLPIADRYDLKVIIFCQEGYTSSLAAFSLQQLGLYNATDMIGGFQAWRDAGFPVDGFAETTPAHVPALLASLPGLMP